MSGRFDIADTSCYNNLMINIDQHQLRDIYVAAWMALDNAPLNDAEAQRISDLMTSVSKEYVGIIGCKPGEDDLTMDRIMSVLTKG